MLNKKRLRLDEQAKTMGWTHRKKGKKNDPYLKIHCHSCEKTTNKKGTTFVDMDQKFRWIAFSEVVEL